MDAEEVLLQLPSQIEIAEAIHALQDGRHRETVRRMASALDLLREGGWEFVQRPQSEPPRITGS